MKKVLTLSGDAFASECRRLEEACAALAPDAVVGIESGGRFVAERIFTHIPHLYVTMRRPTTSGKRGVVSRILPRLPRRLNNFLRLAESGILSIRKPQHVEFRGPIPELPDTCHKVLVVDDAVDSGATLSAVCEALKRVYPGLTVNSATIVVTTSRPTIQPDVTLFRNVLIRFPWSADMKHSAR